MADIVQTPASVVFSTSAKFVQGTLGSAGVVVGQPLYQDVDLTWKLAIATSVAGATVKGLAASGGGIGQPCLICTEDPSLAPGFIADESIVYMLSEAAGKIVTATSFLAYAPGRVACVLMIGKANEKVNLKPIVTDAAVA